MTSLDNGCEIFYIANLFGSNIPSKRNADTLKVYDCLIGGIVTIWANSALPGMMS